MQTSHDKGYVGAGMEGRIAAWYAKNTAKDMAEFRSLAALLAKGLKPGSRVLEVAPGPGYLSIELAKLGCFEQTGLDISRSFVEIAARNAREAEVEVDFRQGNASAMPIESDSCDLVVCRAAFKNFSQPLEAMNEMHRVLKEGGRAVIIDLRKDASRADIDAYIKSVDLDWVNALIYKLTFRYMLIPRAYSREQFAALAADSKFGRAEIAECGVGFEISMTKGSQR